MKNTTRTVLSLASIFLLGYATAHWHAPAPRAQGVKPAYLIVSAEWVEPDKLGPYSAAARPLADKAGMEILGRGTTGGTLQVLEGEWPYKGNVVLEKFDSMDALLRFWNSPEYQEVKKLREGFIKSNFFIAIEATD